MGDPGQGISVTGWLARVTTPGAAQPRWFVAAADNRLDAEVEIRGHPAVGGDQVEIIRQLTVPNMMGFRLRPGEVRQIDAPP